MEKRPSSTDGFLFSFFCSKAKACGQDNLGCTLVLILPLKYCSAFYVRLSLSRAAACCSACAI